MNAVTESVGKAVQARKGGESWPLYLDKLCFRPGGGQSAKGDSLSCVREVYDRCKPNLQQSVDRGTALRRRLAEQYGPENARVVHLRNISRLLLHLARANPLENVGLYAERMTGLPMVPGPAVKGIVSTWACWCQNIQPDGGFPAEFATHRRTFTRTEAVHAAAVLGDNDRGGSTDAGQVVFLGAWPESVPSLELDITTPHPEGGNPIPNPFLAVAPGTDWAFVLIAKPRGNGNAKALLDAAERWLVEALDQAGVGAKTAAGYGRFRSLTEAESGELRKREAETAAKAEKRAAERAAAQAKAREEEAAAKAEAERRAHLTPADLAYEDFVKGILDWTGPARDIATKPPEEKALILRFFRSPEGKAILKGWTNKKGQARIQNLKEAGL